MHDHRPILVLNGSLRWTTALATLARAARPLIAADGGADALARVGLRPDAVVGDLDSLSTATRAWLGESILIHRTDQDCTDFEKALSHAFTDLGLEQLTVLGALGGRIDHTAGNLGILARESRGPDLVFRSEDEILLATTESLVLDAVPGETWSFWTYSPATMVTLEGLRWPIERQPLAIDHRPSISNEAIAHKLRVIPENGTVVACRNLGDKANP